MDGSQQVRERTGKRRDSPPKNRPPGDESDMAFIGLEFAIELRLSVPPTSSNFQVQNVSCLAQVGDIYKSATHANLLVIDRREALTAASSTVRPPAHLAATGNIFSIFLTFVFQEFTKLRLRRIAMNLSTSFNCNEVVRTHQ